jgi:hypothetical protein
LAPCIYGDLPFNYDTHIKYSAKLRELNLIRRNPATILKYQKALCSASESEQDPYLQAVLAYECSVVTYLYDAYRMGFPMDNVDYRSMLAYY